MNPLTASGTQHTTRVPSPSPPTAPDARCGQPIDDEANWTLRGHDKPGPPLEQARASRLGARTIGTLAEVTVGCRCWSRAEGLDARLNPNGAPRGGIVVEIVDQVVDVNEETGEVTQARAFRTYDPYQPRFDLAWTTLTEAQVEPAGCDAGDSDQTGRVIRRLQLHASEGKALITDQDYALHADIGRLLRALLGHHHQ